MKDIGYREEELDRLYREIRMERDIAPLDHRIARLRAEIRERVQHLRALKAKGFPESDSRLVLRLVCRTLAADREYRESVQMLGSAISSSAPTFRSSFVRLSLFNVKQYPGGASRALFEAAD